MLGQGLIETLRNSHLALNGLLSAALLAVLLLLRWLIARQIRRSSMRQAELRRRWLVALRNAFLLLVLLGLVIIWARDLRDLAVSLLAITVAIVLATKELILCITGGMLKAASRAFALGDRIEVAGVRGDVIDQTVLTTTILETGPGEITHQHTGRAVTLPNSMFLSSPVINESFTADYVLHVFTVPVAADSPWQQDERRLLAAAREACAPFLEDARRHISSLASREGLQIPPIDPRVILSVPDPGRINLIVRVPAPARHRGRLEQAILRRYLGAEIEAASAEMFGVGGEPPG